MRVARPNFDVGHIHAAETRRPFWDAVEKLACASDNDAGAVEFSQAFVSCRSAVAHHQTTLRRWGCARSRAKDTPAMWLWEEDPEYQKAQAGMLGVLMVLLFVTGLSTAWIKQIGMPQCLCWCLAHPSLYPQSFFPSRLGY